MSTKTKPSEPMRDVLRDVWGYLAHRIDCPYDPSVFSSPAGDFCTCGYGKLVARVQRALEEN